jgi:ABC-2 type transport system permease protein
MHNRIFLVAKRDYLMAIKSKPFLFGLIVTPILAGSGFIGMAIVRAKPDIAERHIAVVDRTGKVMPALEDAVAHKNAKDIFDTKTGKQTEPRCVLEPVTPNEADPTAQRLELSDRARRHEIFAFLEIGRDALRAPEDKDPEKLDAAYRVDYYSNAAGIDETRSWLSGPVNDALRRTRLAQYGVAPAHFAEVLAPAAMQSMSLLARDAKTGAIEKAHKKNELEGFIVPFAMMMLLAMMVLMSSAPMLGAVADDKQQRVYEMLLGSATPFELMMGKMLSAVCLTLTSSTLYVVASLFVLESMAMMGMAPLSVLPWFFLYMVADVLVVSSLAIGVGSACASPNDAQHLAMLVMAPTLIPLFLMAPIIQAPNGPMATAMSFMPPFTPLIMLMRQAMPGGVPAWEPWVALVGVIAWTLFITWGAARIFRIGILMQGKTAKISEMARWAVRG